MHEYKNTFQFVPFRDFIGGRHGNDLVRSQAQLAKEVLAEIPEQFLSYMKAHGVKPKPPLQRQSTFTGSVAGSVAGSVPPSPAPSQQSAAAAASRYPEPPPAYSR